MANLSNINNILRTGSLGVGINRDPLGAFEISSATKPGVKMFNTSTNGKTYEAYSDTNGNYIIYDQDADDNRFVINTSGNATFTGNVSITKASTPELILTDTTNNVNLLIAVDDANTFLRSSSGAPILFQTNAGTTALTLDASQNATFAGTISSSTLTVGNFGTSRFTDTGAFPLQLNRGLPVDVYGTNGVFLGLGSYSTGTTYVDAARIVANLQSATSGDFFIQVNNGGSYTNALRINNDTNAAFYGNVGIGTGTTSPTSLLQIKKATLPRITLTKTGILDWFIGNPSQGTSNTFSIGTNSGSNTEILNLTNTGDVGIGIDTPNKKLTVYGGNDNGIWVDSSGSQYTSIAWGNNGSEKANIAYDNTNANFAVSAYGASNIIFSNNGSERMRIESDGIISIGEGATQSWINNKVQVTTTAVSGINLTNIDRTAANLIRFTNPEYSTTAQVGLLLKVFPNSDARQGAGLLMTGGSDNAASNLSLFVSKNNGSGASQSYSALHIAGNTGDVMIGAGSGGYKLEVKDGQDSILFGGLVVERSANTTAVCLNAVGGALNLNTNSSMPLKFRIGNTSMQTINTDGGRAYAGFGGWRMFEYIYNVSIANGATIDLLQNISAHTDLHMVQIAIRMFHSGRTYYVGSGVVGGYGMNLIGSGSGFTNGGLTSASVSTGIRKLQITQSSGFTADASIYIQFRLDSPSGINVLNGTLSSL